MKTTTRTPISTTVSLLVLAAIFAITAVLTFGGRRALGRTLDAQPTQSDLQRARADAIAAIPQLPKDTESKLAAALEPVLAPITASFSDPLVDRAGVSQISRPTSVNLAPASLSNIPLAPIVPAKLSRLTEWQLAVRSAYASGQTPPSITSAYLISEVSPTGRMNMKGAQGAWLYIDSEKRQITANVGSKFYDGTLVSVNPDPVNGGIVFRTSAGETKVVHWDRQEDFSTTSPANQSAPDNSQQARPQSPVPQTKPVSQNNLVPSPINTRNPNLDQPASNTARSQIKSSDDYSDLQVAVRDRYQPRPNNAPIVKSENANTGNDVVISPTVKSEITKPITTASSESNALTVAAPRDIKFSHSRAIYASNPRPVSDNPLSFRARHNVLNLDDAASFSPNAVTATATYIEQEPTAKTETTNKPEIKAPGASPDNASTKNQAPQETLLAKASPSPNTASDSPKPTATPAAAVIATIPAPPLTLCNASYRGESIVITNEANRPISLLNFINRMNDAYNANIVLDYDVQEIPVRLTVNNAPWSSILRTLLDLNDLDMVCLDGGIVQIAKRSKIVAMGDLRRRSAPIIREVFTLRYLQQTAGGRTNLAGQTQASNGATIQTLEDAIRDILKAGGDVRGEARRVPGRNQLLVAATQDQMTEIRDLIARVDRPGYQVKISALVYTANENKLQDIGSQLAIVVGNAGGTNLGGGTTLPNTSTTSGSGSGSGNSGQPAGGINPGGIPGLATGMRPPTNGLGASNPLATLGVTSLFGTAQFAYQLTLAQQKGVVNIQSRPFGYVSDGEPFELVAGSQIPVVTTTIAGGAPFQSGQVQFIEASRITRITPQVAEDEQGRPNYVTLTIQLENNSVDTSLGTFNGVPGVNRQSLQTILRLKTGETVVIGGLAADQVSNSTSKVPGLSDVPLLGNLFKKKTKQETRDRLYFAITVEVIPLDSPMRNFPAPADASTTPPAPPAPIGQKKTN